LCELYRTEEETNQENDQNGNDSGKRNEKDKASAGVDNRLCRLSGLIGLDKEREGGASDEEEMEEEEEENEGGGGGRPRAQVTMTFDMGGARGRGGGRKVVSTRRHKAGEKVGGAGGGGWDWRDSISKWLRKLGQVKTLTRQRASTGKSVVYAQQKAGAALVKYALLRTESIEFSFGLALGAFPPSSLFSWMTSKMSFFTKALSSR
jgi:hypothetical protein